MPPEDHSKPAEVQDTSNDAQSGGSDAESAVAGQEKPAEMVAKEQEQAEQRKLGRTPSSVDLPAVELASDGQAVSKQQANPKTEGGAGPSDSPAAPEAPRAPEAPPSPAMRSPVKNKEAEEAAKQIHDACDRIGTDEDSVFKALEGKTPQQVAEIRKAYQGRYGITLLKQMESELSGDDWKKARELLGATNPVEDRALAVPGPEYRGEGVKRSLEWERRTALEGDTVQSVAESKLGAGATKEQIEAYTKEIKMLNRLDGDTLTKTQDLILPGHTADGALITFDRDGTKHISRLDGATKTENSDGSSYEVKPLPGGGYECAHRGNKAEDFHYYTRTPDGNGGYVEKHTGPLSGDNYELTRSGDGSYKLKAFSLEKDHTAYDDAHPDPRVERARLLDAADAKIADSDKRAQFHADVERFEERGRHEKLSPEQKARFYHQVGRLLDATDSSNPNLPKEADRIKVAGEILSHAANPTRIDQGDNGTCGVATLESRIFTKDPDVAARVISDVALTGKLHPPDGKDIDPSLLKPDEEAQKDIGENLENGKRTYASQLFQNAAVTIAHPDYRRVDVPAGTKPPDTGYRYGDDQRGTNLGPDDVKNINKELTGRDDVPVLSNGNLYDPKQAGSDFPTTEKELNDRLAQLKKQGKLPAVIQVETSHEPFWTDSNGGDAGGAGGGHFVTITDYHPGPPATVEMANQWGAKSCHDVTVQALYLATTGESTVESLKRLEDVVNHEDPQKVDLSLKLEMLRKQREQNKISKEDFLKQTEETMVEAHRRANASRSKDAYQQLHQTDVAYRTLFMHKGEAAKLGVTEDDMADIDDHVVARNKKK